MIENPEKVRRLLPLLAAEKHTNLKALSLLCGKNEAYLQQFCKKGSPKRLPEDVRAVLGKELGQHPDTFKDGTERPLDGTNTMPTGSGKSDLIANMLQAKVLEIDVRGGMGGGGVSTLVNHTDDNGNTIQIDDAKAEWSMPEEYLRAELHGSPRHVRIIEVQGDSMEPTLRSGDRVMIDTQQKNVSPDGIFALWDGFGVVVKRVERVWGEEAISIKSDNPNSGDIQRTLEEVAIIGRVIWYGRKI